MKEIAIPRIIIGATGSNSGKTLLTCGILKCLTNRGLQAASFKCGPDYIDTMFHRFVTGKNSINLDRFFTGKAMTKYIFAKSAAACDIALIEGVMGYYDGIIGVSDQASTYEIAQITKSPAILVANVRGMSTSAVAMLKGFLQYRKKSHIKGIILNHISATFYPKMKEMIERQLPVEVLGYVPNMEEIKIDSRHLGLLAPQEIQDLSEQIDLFSAALEKTVAIDRLLQLANQAEVLTYTEPALPRLKSPIRIGVAADAAFSFQYEDNIELLSRMGAQICYFSPLKDQSLPDNICGLWLGGGYPEHFAKELSENRAMRACIKTAIANGMPCIAECGGFLYLHQSLQDERGDYYEQVGVIPAKAYKTEKLQRFGYINLHLSKKSLLGKSGTQLPAHEFHYWDSESPGEDFVASKPLGNKKYRCVHAADNLYSGFPHLYLYADTKAAFCYLKAAALYGEKNQ